MTQYALRNRILNLLVLMTLGFICNPAFANEGPFLLNGVLDLSQYDFNKDGITSCAGEWDLYWNKLLTPSDFANSTLKPTHHVLVPGYWNLNSYDGATIPAFGAATYHGIIYLPKGNTVYGLRIPQMKTSYRLWINGDLVSENGTIGLNSDTQKPASRIQDAFFKVDSPVAEIVCQVANYHYRVGGMSVPMRIGTPRQIIENHIFRAGIDFFVIGCILIMGLYHIALFFFGRRHKGSLYLGLFCIPMAIRLMTLGEILFTMIIPKFPWEILVRLELMAMPLGILLFLLFIKSAFPEEMIPRIDRIIIAAMIPFIFCFLLLPVSMSNRLVLPVQIMIIPPIIYILTRSVKAFIRKSAGSGYMTIGIFILTVAVINDILHSNMIIHSMFITPYGFLALVISQSLLLAEASSVAFARLEETTLNLSHMYSSVTRFVPAEFLHHLNKRFNAEIKFGNRVLRDATLLHWDILHFDKITESMDPIDREQFLSWFIECMGPIVRKNNGFINQYVGESIVSLFPNNPAEAVRAAIEIHCELERINTERAVSGKPVIALGIGIHSGPVLIGISDSTERIENSASSETVHLATKVGKIAGEYGAGILISGTSLVRMGGNVGFMIRSIDLTRLSDNSPRTSLFEVFDIDCASVRDKKMITKETLEKGISAFYNGDFTESKNMFLHAQSLFTDDSVPKVFLKRINEKTKNAIIL